VNPRGICAIVPVKEFSDAKQRLAAALPSHLRSELAVTMLEDVLDALSRVSELAQIAVITIDPAAIALARRFGARIMSDRPHGGHTSVVNAAAQLLAEEGWEGMLQVPGDVPLVSSEEISRLVTQHRSPPSFTIAPAHDERGSNAVLVSPPDAVPLTFGDDSFYPHLRTARQHRIEPTIVRLPGVALDIDAPADIQAFRRLRSNTRTQRFIDACDIGAEGSASTVAEASQ
jgi:2-phospho-L-lactate/phosphoenolpyruvate guanylyltransferase